MLRQLKSFCLFVLFVLSISFLSGCDQVKSFSEYFSGPKEKRAESPSPTALPQQKTQSSEVLAPNVLAKVGNWQITIEDFNNRLKNLKQVLPEYDIVDLDSQKMVLEELIRQQLLVLDAEQSGISNKKEVTEAVEEFRKTILVREVANKLLEGVVATEAEALEYYNNNKEIFVKPAEWNVREIVANTQTGANEILIEALRGEVVFGDLARQRSIGKSAVKGGDLSFSEAPFPAMANALLSLEVGGISSVFKGPEGFYIVKLEEKKGGEAESFLEVKEEIINGLTMLKQQNVLMERLNALRLKTPVVINENLLTKE